MFTKASNQSATANNSSTVTPVTSKDETAVTSVLTGNGNNSNNTNNTNVANVSIIGNSFEEAKASIKARKRKERQESVSSNSHEKKVIRSNSEERPVGNNGGENGCGNVGNKDMRRVSSNEDFKDYCQNQKAEVIATLAVQFDGPVRIAPNNICIEDYDYEKRRLCERFTKPMVPRGRYLRKAKKFAKDKPKKKDVQDVDKLNETNNSLHPGSTESNSDEKRSPSPTNNNQSPAIDLSTLHQQIDHCEPIPSQNRNVLDSDSDSVTPSISVASNRLLSSPRNSIIITQRFYLNPNVLQNNLDKHPNPVEQRQKHLAKQINSLKKKIKKYDEEFEAQQGYRPSHADKLNDKNIKKLCSDLNKLKKELKQLQEDSVSILSGAEGFKENKPKTNVSLKDTVIEIEKRLESKRNSCERSSVIDDLNNEQLVEEKVAVQKALLYLESIHGRPSSRDDKDIARPLYDRYRILKRMVARLNSISNVIELQTIHEHETMEFVSLPTQQQQTNPTLASSDSDEKDVKSPTSTSGGAGSTDSDTDTSIGENLHSLSLEELIELQKSTSEEKKRLRRSLKEFEANFESNAGKKMQKEDRAPLDPTYVAYKKAKAKLRLLDALVGKQSL